jgi:hypothetical protein
MLPVIQADLLTRLGNTTPTSIQSLFYPRGLCRGGQLDASSTISYHAMRDTNRPNYNSPTPHAWQHLASAVTVLPLAAVIDIPSKRLPEGRPFITVPTRSQFGRQWNVLTAA